VPWVLSLAWASIRLGVTGYGDIGAWCCFTSDEVRLLVNFVPRCKCRKTPLNFSPTYLHVANMMCPGTIIANMFLMYARLYFLLFRAHRRLVSLDDSSSRNLSGSGSRQLDGSGSGGRAVSARHTRRLKRVTHAPHPPPPNSSLLRAKALVLIHCPLM
jgi:hypothetical protein